MGTRGPRRIPVSTENQWFQRIDALIRSRAKRTREGLFVVEGVRSIDRLRADPGWRVEALLTCPDRRRSAWARAVLREVEAAVHLELAAPLLARLSARDETSEVMAVVARPPEDLDRIPLPADALVVALDRIGRPGNLGAILRSCDALGAHGVVLAGHCADPFDPAAVRAAAGSLFAVPVARAGSNEEWDAWLARAREVRPGMALVGTSAHAPAPLAGCDLRGPAVLLFGSETAGLSSRMRERCDALVGIPMRGTASSLNLACAVTAVLWEAGRQRGAASG